MAGMSDFAITEENKKTKERVKKEENKKENMSFKERFFKVQQEIKIAKKNKNEFVGFSYWNAEDVLKEFKKISQCYNIIILCSDSVVSFGDNLCIKSVARACDVFSEESIETEAYAGIEPSKKKLDISQLFGSASSYARKYALNGLLGLSEASLDPDNQQLDNDSQQKEIIELSFLEKKQKALRYIEALPQSETKDVIALEAMNATSNEDIEKIKQKLREIRNERKQIHV